MNREENAAKKLIISPTWNIPIGEPWVSDSGQVGLIIKHKDRNGVIHFEFVALDYINSETIKTVISRRPK